MNILQQYIKELQDFELVNKENLHFTNLITVQDATDVLERFEVALINELTCEELLKLQHGYNEISQE